MSPAWIIIHSIVNVVVTFVTVVMATRNARIAKKNRIDATKNLRFAVENERNATKNLRFAVENERNAKKLAVQATMNAALGQRLN